MKRNEEWETSIPVVECNWKQIAEPVMQLYTETTDGSMIELKETSMGWCYEDADPDFGSCQAKELLDHLESVLANEPVTVKSDSNCVEVKPQVFYIFFQNPLHVFLSMIEDNVFILIRLNAHYKCEKGFAQLLIHVVGSKCC